MSLSTDFVIFIVGIVGVMALMISQSQRPQLKRVKVRSKYRK